MEKWEKEHAQEVIENMVKNYLYYYPKYKIVAASYEGKIEGYIQGISFADKEFSKKMKLHSFTLMYRGIKGRAEQ